MEYYRTVKNEVVGKYQILVLKKPQVAKEYVTIDVKFKNKQKQCETS